MRRLFLTIIVLIAVVCSLAACSKKDIESNFKTYEETSSSFSDSLNLNMEKDEIAEYKHFFALFLKEASSLNLNNSVNQNAANAETRPSGTENSSKSGSINAGISQSLFNYLSLESNRNSVLLKAKELNNGELHNACVYFVSEALRRVNYKIPLSVSNTTTLINILANDGWKKSYDLTQLKPGSICFTTDEQGGLGSPTHAYVFMNWASSSHDTVYVCDNQSYDYDSVYHLRSLKLTYLNNDKNKPKEASLFFYYK